MLGTGPLALYMLLQPKDIPRFHKKSIPFKQTSKNYL